MKAWKPLPAVDGLSEMARIGNRGLMTAVSCNALHLHLAANGLGGGRDDSASAERGVTSPGMKILRWACPDSGALSRQRPCIIGRTTLMERDALLMQEAVSQWDQQEWCLRSEEI